MSRLNRLERDRGPLWVDAVEKGSAKRICAFYRGFFSDKFSFVGLFHLLKGRSPCARSRRIRRSPDMVRKCFEVLDGSGKVELVARAREAPQPHAFKAMVSL